MANLEKLNVQRFGDLKELMVAGESAARYAVQTALTTVEQALGKAEIATDKRFDSEGYSGDRNVM